MATIRSARLFAAYGVGTAPNVVYTVPSGFIAVVKSVFSQNNGAGGDYLIVYTTPAGIGLNFFLRRVEPWPSNQIDEWKPWFAMEPGDTLSVYTNVGQTNVVAYGALLTT